MKVPCAWLLVVVLGYGFLAAPAAQAPQTKSAALEPWPDAKVIADRRKSAENRRLFRTAEPLAFTLIANFRSVNSERDPKSTKTFPATLEFTKEDGTKGSITLQIRGRGHARRQICSFLPIRLELPKEQTRGTVFDGHGALKLVTHCRNGSEEYVLREYVPYQIYNLLTPRSFRARLAQVTYVDTSSKKALPVKHAMFIEDDDDVAKRLDGRIIELEKATFVRVDMETVTLMSIFEYLIGNTDMSLFLQHNIRLVQTVNGLRYPVPYDFDYAGLVDAGYAVPGAHLGIASVRDRLYRGPCRTAAELAPFFGKMRAIRAEVEDLYKTMPGFSNSYRNNALSYLNEFYRTIDRPNDVKRAFIDGCNGRPYM
jgi:hypothetical protein